MPPRDCREACGANAKGQRVLTTHIWQECLDLAEQLRKTNLGIKIYALCKETIERVFADAKGKHGMRYARHRGLARVSSWVRLKFVAFNLKNWPYGGPGSPSPTCFLHLFLLFSPSFLCRKIL